jgi:hypothetical protein
MSRVLLRGEGVSAEIIPDEGARVQSLVDLASRRQLLYQRVVPQGPRDDFLSCSTGGWDAMFPNDTPWADHPDHGRVWSTPFETLSASERTAVFRGAIERPPVTIERGFELLAPPRRGLRVTTILDALEDTGPFLWACHPMLAVGQGWRIAVEAESIVADTEAPGRFTPGPLSQKDRARAFTIPASGEGWAEVLYATNASVARVGSPDGAATTQIAWDDGYLPELWLVTVTGQLGLDLCFLFEPCTSRPYRLDDAIASGRAAHLDRGDPRQFWCELASLDHSTAPQAW